MPNIVVIVEVGTFVSISCTAFSRSVRPIPAASVDVIIVEVGTFVSISCTAFSRSVRQIPAACVQY